MTITDDSREVAWSSGNRISRFTSIGSRGAEPATMRFSDGYQVCARCRQSVPLSVWQCARCGQPFAAGMVPPGQTLIFRRRPALGAPAVAPGRWQLGSDPLLFIIVGLSLGLVLSLLGQGRLHATGQPQRSNQVGPEWRTAPAPRRVAVRIEEPRWSR
jgi:hypothetical protein